MRLWGRRGPRFALAARARSRHALSPMLCLAVSTLHCDPRHAVSRGVGIELIDILPR